MSDTAQKIAQLHELYVSLTGFEIRLDAAREADWFRWVKAGFVEDDLKICVHHIRKGIQNKSRNEGALKFRNLIGNPDYFEEDLAVAKAELRKPKVNQARAAVLTASGRPGDWKPEDSQKATKETKRSEAKPAAEIIAAQFEELRKLKESL